MNDKVKIALITVFPAALTSLVTAFATIRGASNQLAKIDQSLQVVEGRATSLESAGSLVPVGCVVAWWGDWSDPASRPKGYEFCDGTDVSTSGSPILGQRKPNLRGSFVRGAKAATENIMTLSPQGREKTEPMKTDGTKLTVAQMPAHSHAGSALEAGDHSHGTGGKAAHDDNGGGDTHFALGDPNDDRSWPGITIKNAGNHTHNLKIQETGSGEAHSHAIEPFSILPPCVELYYLIRVK